MHSGLKIHQIDGVIEAMEAFSWLLQKTKSNSNYYADLTGCRYM